MSVLKGVPVESMREIAAEAWEPVFRPLVYREALDLAASHAARGERVYIVSAALQEVVEGSSQRARASTARSRRGPRSSDGVYTGRLERRLYGSAKAEALEELARAEGIELASSTAYSDSHSDDAVPRGGRAPGRRQSRIGRSGGSRANAAGPCCASGDGVRTA